MSRRGSVKQPAMGVNDFEQPRRPKRRERFQAGMNMVVPWAKPVVLIEPDSSKLRSAGVRPAINMECVSWIHCLKL